MIQLFNSWENPTSSSRNNLVFANRNQLYGAYLLRRCYEKTLAKAFVFASSICLLFILIPFIVSFISLKEKMGTYDSKDVVVDLIGIEVVKPQIFPALPKQQIAVLPSTFKFSVPRVIDEVINENFPVQNPDNNANPGLNNNIVDSVFSYDIVPVDTTSHADIPIEITDVQEIPQFPGGTSAMMNYLTSHIRYPDNARKSNIHGTVYLSFVVDKEGKLADVVVMRGIGGGCDEEALSVVKNMPLWSPGKQNGRPVMVRLVLPVQFTLR